MRDSVLKVGWHIHDLGISSTPTGYRAQQFCSIRVVRGREYLRRGARFHDLALSQDLQPVADRAHRGQIVRNEQQRNSLG